MQLSKIRHRLLDPIVISALLLGGLSIVNLFVELLPKGAREPPVPTGQMPVKVFRYDQLKPDADLGAIISKDVIVSGSFATEGFFLAENAPDESGWGRTFGLFTPKGLEKPVLFDWGRVSAETAVVVMEALRNRDPQIGSPFGSFEKLQDPIAVVALETVTKKMPSVALVSDQIVFKRRDLPGTQSLEYEAGTDFKQFGIWLSGIVLASFLLFQRLRHAID